MNEICGDNRFEIIAKAKKHLLDATNIDTSPKEMEVLDGFLFRCWQMGWLDRYDEQTEPKRGEWIWDAKSKVFRCSECNHYPWRVNTCENDEIFTDLDRTNAFRFCPTCRADMRGEP